MLSQGHSIDHLAWGPLDLYKVVNDLKTIGVTFSSNPNPRRYPACNFVGGDGEAGAPAIRRLYCAQPDQLPHRIVFLEAPDGVRRAGATPGSRWTLRKSQIPNPKTQSAQDLRQATDTAISYEAGTRKRSTGILIRASGEARRMRKPCRRSAKPELRRSRRKRPSC